MGCLKSSFFSEHHLEPLNRNCTPSVACEVGVTEEGPGERETRAGGQQEACVSHCSRPQGFISKHFLANLSSERRGSFFGWWLGKVVSHHFQAKTGAAWTPLAVPGFNPSRSPNSKGHHKDFLIRLLLCLET